jgi:uroporphyrinogen decarboxylase
MNDIGKDVSMMTSRERVLAALDHREPDRVPIVIGGSAQKIAESTLRELLQHYGLAGDSLRRVFAQFRFEPVSEPLWQALGVDARHVYWQPERNFSIELQERGEKYIDEWGLDYDYSRGGGATSCLYRLAPLREVSEQDLDTYAWPNPHAYDRTKGMKEVAQKLFNEGRYAVYAYRNGGIFDYASYLRGTERFMMDLVINKSFVKRLLWKITEILISYYESLLSAVGPYVHVVEIADDLGAQNGPMISPQMYDEFIKPCHKALIQTIKHDYPKIKVMIHCDGGVRPLLPGLIDAGIDILNPVQVTAGGMEPAALKRDFGDALVFQGGIDTQNLLINATPNQVADEVKRMIDTLGPGGGYLFGPSHNILADIPVENVIAMFETAQSYGLG